MNSKICKAVKHFNRPKTLLTNAHYQRLKKYESLRKKISEDQESIEQFRKKILTDVYFEKYKRLNNHEKSKLACSGKIWYDFACLDNRPQFPLCRDLQIFQTLDQKVKLVPLPKGEYLNNKIFWESFKVALTHSSTSIEGNSLSKDDNRLILDEFADEISKGISFSSSDINYDRVYRYIKPEKQKDVDEVLSHAAAMEYVKTIIGQPLTIDHIKNIASIFLPKHNDGWIVGYLPESIEGYRKVPIRVTGSYIVRPYPHEVPVLMERILSQYFKHINDGVYHKVACVLNLVYNVLFIHPFDDYNGRTARLLLNMELFKHGYFGCNINVKDREEYLSHFDNVFYSLNYTTLYRFYATAISKFIEEIIRYEKTSTY